jgi:1-phosphatidylinositol-3-phosphate 5-kinase
MTIKITKVISGDIPHSVQVSWTFSELLLDLFLIVFPGDLRVCMYCGKVVLSYLESADIGAELCADLRALHDDLQTKFGSANLSPVTPTQGQGGTGGPGGVPSLPDREETASRRKHSVGYQEERFGFNR